MSSVALRGMTWSHARGHEPLVACSAAWRTRTGVDVVWDHRSLQDFETFPIEELARRYDLMVIDHPHVGQVARNNCLVPLDDPRNGALSQATVGPSWESYAWEGFQWALPIDAAAQVLAYRPDRLHAPPDRPELIALARRGALLCPLRPPHSLMALYSLAGNLGARFSPGDRQFIDETAGVEALERLRELTADIDRRCFSWDPIAVFEQMTGEHSPIACAPLIYGYVNYATSGFRPSRLRFADLAPIGTHGPLGSALGGTGLAVSALSRHRDEAVTFAYWVASGPTQAMLYAPSGGQPAHPQAWEDEDINAATDAFYRRTRRTLEGARLRPRHNGYMRFQTEQLRSSSTRP